MNRILAELFTAKYPSWTTNFVDHIPKGEGAQYTWMLRNCAGRAPAEIATADDEK